MNADPSHARQFDFRFAGRRPEESPGESAMPFVSARTDTRAFPDTRAFDTESCLRTLESRYRSALSRAVAAKARYLALTGSPSATPPTIERAQRRWQLLQLQRKAFARRMAAIEGSERDGIAAGGPG